jgi:hypothetical protein
MLVGILHTMIPINSYKVTTLAANFPAEDESIKPSVYGMIDLRCCIL